MKYHCGLLNVRPEESLALRRYRTKAWALLKPQWAHELNALLLTPGFPNTYWAHVFQRSIVTVHYYIKDRLRWEDYADEAVENWMSVTRDDAVRLSRLRPERGVVPLICQMRAVEDMKHMTAAQVARDYAINVSALSRWRMDGFNTRRLLPPGFEWLVPKR